MRIFIICSKSFYDRIPDIKKALEERGHSITLPNCYDNPHTEDEYRNMGTDKHAAWKSEMIRHSEKVIGENDAVLVLNFDKKGIANYIGGATFLEMYDAFRLNKKIFIWNGIPEGMLKDEIIGFNPAVIDGDISLIT
ncbi:MAG: hypothetical protein PHP35_00365 [Candidatus Colwellbacteria bacterium]|nr:hypothetical protein [Candidatus Colwellbacteria bacterium]